MSVTYVIKRNGKKERADLSKIQNRIISLSDGLSVDPIRIAAKVAGSLADNISSIELDNVAANICANMNSEHLDYELLASRILISRCHKITSDDYGITVKNLYELGMVNEDFYLLVMRNIDKINEVLNYDNDYLFTYFGFMTLQKSYLLKHNNIIIERPQHLYMRVALAIHGNDFEHTFETYKMMSEHYFIHATPTLFNSGTKTQQMSSCFLMCPKADSIEGIYESLKDCAIISKYAGGIGMSITDIRASGSRINGTNGISTGIIPMLKVYDSTASYVDQGGGKRRGSFAMYIEPWHQDIFDFINMKKPTAGTEELRARNLFYALWIPDLFMKRVQSNEDWTLFSPDTAKGLSSTYGEEFENLYCQYEKDPNIPKRTIKARELMIEIINSQIETGGPYILYKDACNSKSNQKNLGTIKCSNLCTEIVQFTSPEEIAVCNLASINLTKLCQNKEFDFNMLRTVTRMLVYNLNKIIDINFYPVKEAETSNKKNRPIGIGIQGLADVFAKMRYCFDDENAAQLNKDIFETMYYAALEESCELSMKYGTYDSYEGSPISQGILQCDMWNVTPSNRWNWNQLRENIKTYGIRNSLLIAPMPTGTTAQILGNCESIEVMTSNYYTRRVLAGEFAIFNKYLAQDLHKEGLWNQHIINQIIRDKGSIQNIKEIPQDVRTLYRTVWEIKQKSIMDLAIGRSPYICQSQSLNIHIAKPTFDQIYSMLFYGWKNGLKTGLYYLRTQPNVDPHNVTCENCSA